LIKTLVIIIFLIIIFFFFFNLSYLMFSFVIDFLNRSSNPEYLWHKISFLLSFQELYIGFLHCFCFFNLNTNELSKLLKRFPSKIQKESHLIASTICDFGKVGSYAFSNFRIGLDSESALMFLTSSVLRLPIESIPLLSSLAIILEYSLSSSYY